MAPCINAQSSYPQSVVVWQPVVGSVGPAGEKQRETPKKNPGNDASDSLNSRERELNGDL